MLTGRTRARARVPRAAQLEAEEGGALEVVGRPQVGEPLTR
jgi:hypothetical protein